MNMEEKLKKRRLEEEKKLLARREKRGFFGGRLKDVFSHKVNIEDEQEDTVDTDIVDNIIQEYKIEREEQYRPPINEDPEVKKNRLLRGLETIHKSQKDFITTEYNKGEARIAEIHQKDVKEKTDEWELQRIELKKELEESLENATDAEDRHDARKRYKDDISELQEIIGDETTELKDKLEEQLDELKEEFDEKISELDDQYEVNKESIIDETFDDKDLDYINDEFAASKITFDTLEQYIEDDEEEEEYTSREYSSPSFSASSILHGGIALIGVGILFMVANTVFDTLSDANTQSNLTQSTDMVSIISSSTSFFPIHILVLIGVPVLIYFMIRMMRSF